MAATAACRWIALAALACAAPVFAHSPADAPPVPVLDVASGAADAVRVVDAFSAAIKAGQLDEAAALLDPGVLVLESGGSERTRDQYLAEHAQADADYLKDARQELRYRQARVVGDIAWVGSESLSTRDKDGKPSASLGTETMLLKRTAQGWKIVHIHWSSRPAPAG